MKLTKQLTLLGLCLVLMLNVLPMVWINLLRLSTLAILVDPSAKQRLNLIAFSSSLTETIGHVSCGSFRAVLEWRIITNDFHELFVPDSRCRELLRRWYRIQAWNPYLSSTDHARFAQIWDALSNHNKNDYGAVIESSASEGVRLNRRSPHFIMELIDYADRYRQSGEIERLLKVEEQMRAWKPRFLATNPRISRYGREFVFEGFDADLRDIEDTPDVEVLLIWRTKSPSNYQDNWRLIIDDRWVEVVKLRNLLADPGFEWESARERTMVFSREVYPVSLAHHWIEHGEGRDDDDTNYLVINRDKSATQAGLASMRLALSPSVLYLQGGEIRSDGVGRGYLGRRCIGSTFEDKRPYSYIAQDIRTEDWQGYAGIFAPELGRSICEIWLLSGAPGSVMFDNVTLFALPAG